MVWTIAATSLLASVLSSPGCGTVRQRQVPHVRGADSASLSVLQEGRARSQTFAGLVEALERGDVIVLVRVRMCAPTLEVRAKGEMSFFSAVLGFRYVCITIYVPEHPEEMIVWLAHELQHAVEIAQAVEVRDQHTLTQFYKQFGKWTGSGWDSEAARDTSRRVREELAASRRKVRQ